VNKSVTNICFSENSISLDGATALANALKVNTSVENIDLSHNDIGTEGAFAFADVLKVNTSLTELGLHNSEVCDKGILAAACFGAPDVRDVVVCACRLFISVNRRALAAHVRVVDE
jgi:Ran GTPase-activating protein (RanGAP) involved in mRNA processing and transport